MFAVLLAAAAPTSVPFNMTRLVEVTDISSLAVSPDERWLAFRLDQPSVARNQVRLRWAVVPVDGSAPARILADGGVGLANGAGVLESERPLWLPDSRGLLFRAHIGGETQIWRADLVGGAAKQVTSDPGDVVTFRLVGESDAIRYVAGAPRALTAQVERAIRDHGVRLDSRVALSAGAVGGFDRGAGPVSVRMTGEWFDREPLLTSRRVADQPLRGGGYAVLPPGLEEEALGQPPSARYDAGLTAFACRLLDCSDLKVSAIVPLRGGDGSLITTSDAGRRQTLWRVAQGRLRRLVRGVGLLSGDRDGSSPCAVTRRFAFCIEAGPDRPPRLVQVDLARGTLRTLHAPNAALQASLPGTAERLVWRGPQGSAFHGVLIKPREPRQSQRMPLVLQYYSCSGFLRGGVGDELPYQALAARGIATLCIERVADPGQGDRIEDYRAALGGIEKIIEALDHRNVIDPAKVGMHGLSFGSEVAFWTARRSNLLRTVSVASGQIEPSFYWFESFPGRDTMSRMSSSWALGPPGGERWLEIAPASDTGRIDIPLLMQLPEQEARWSIELITRLARSGKPVEVFVFPEASHIKYLPRQKLAAYERNLEWFSFWLTGDASGSRDDPDRVQRWRAMATRLRFDQ